MSKIVITFGVLPWEHRHCVNWRFFLTSKKKVYHSKQWTVSKVSALVKVDFIWECVHYWATKKWLNCPHQRVSVLSRLNLEKMKGFSPGTKKTVHNDGVSLKWGSTVDVSVSSMMRIVPFLIHAHPSPNPRDDWNNNQPVFFCWCSLKNEIWRVYFSFSLASLNQRKNVRRRQI